MEGEVELKEMHSDGIKQKSYSYESLGLLYTPFKGRSVLYYEHTLTSSSTS